MKTPQGSREQPGTPWSHGRADPGWTGVPGRPDLRPACLTGSAICPSVSLSAWETAWMVVELEDGDSQQMTSLWCALLSLMFYLIACAFVGSYCSMVRGRPRFEGFYLGGLLGPFGVIT